MLLELNNFDEAMLATGMLGDITQAFHRALKNHNLVEVRIMDLPSMKSDTMLRKALTSVKLDDERNVLWIDADGFQMRLNYTKYDVGTESHMHKKFYFQSEHISLTVIIYLNEVQ